MAAIPRGRQRAPSADEPAPPLPGESMPLPYDEEPPLPDEPVPDDGDDGWDARWDEDACAWRFSNRFTGLTQWENPRVPEAIAPAASSYDRLSTNGPSAPAASAAAAAPSAPAKRLHGGYNPAIHGSYDPNADYALEAQKDEEEAEKAAAAQAAGYATVEAHEYAVKAQFNRFTGKYQQAGMGPELHNDENKSKRQMNAYFDVDAAANSHEGRSLKAERREKKITKQELKAFREKRRNKKEERLRAWLRD